MNSEDSFDLPVEYKGVQQIFKASLVVYGYSHRFHVEVNGHEIIFEPDEERNYRAIVNNDEKDHRPQVDIALLILISAALEALVK